MSSTRWRLAFFIPFLAAVLVSCSEKQATEPNVPTPGGGGSPPPSGTDSIPPTVSSVAPGDNAQNVPGSTTVRAVFSEAIAPSSANGQTFLVVGEGPVTGTVATSGSTVTFTPSSSLLGERTYTATLTTGIHDAAGNALASTYTWTFTTAGQAPVANAGPDQQVAFGATVILDGSQSFDPDGKQLSYTWTQTAGPDVTGGAGHLVSAQPSFTAPRTNATIDFNLVVSDGISNSAPDPIRIFVSGDDAPPSVAQVDPGNGATDVSRTTTVRATFSEAIAENSATTSTFTLANGGSVSGTVAVSGPTVTFTPSSPLAANTAYTATLSTGIQDLAGNPMTQPYTWSFTTGGSPPVANAGADQSVPVGASVTLDGTQSFDPDGQSLTYHWTQTSGPDVTGGSGTFSVASPTFTAPSSVATLTFELVVNDGFSPSAPDQVQVSVTGGANVVYVSPSGSDSNPGTAAAPLQSVNAAVAAASGSGADVYLAGGTYTETTFALASGVDLLGGFDAGFTNRDPGAHPTVLDGGTTALSGIGVSNVRLDGITIRSANATGSGQSSYAAFLRGSSGIVFHDCTLQAGNGGPGSGGSPGSPGAGGDTGADGGTGTCSSLSSPGAGGGGGGGANAGGGGGAGGSLTTVFVAESGQGGSGASGGGGGAAGTVTSRNHNAQSGTAGSAGSSGTNGSAGASFGGLSDSGYEPASGGDGGSDGTGGSGGGGGGGSSGAPAGGDSGGGSGNGGGGGGGGGFPGTGGSGGTGAGASLALVMVSSSNITVDGCTLRTGSGGTGGSGGAGGAGGPGGGGGAGARECNKTVGSGGSGGGGGTGGRGGHGGGGGGGPSIGIAYDAASTLSESGNSYALGNAGAGGPSPGQAGASGARQNVYRIGSGAPPLSAARLRTTR